MVSTCKLSFCHLFHQVALDVRLQVARRFFVHRLARRCGALTTSVRRATLLWVLGTPTFLADKQHACATLLERELVVAGQVSSLTVRLL